VSLVEKPKPDTITVDPPEPKFGLSDMDGTVTGSAGAMVVGGADWVNDVIVDDSEESVDVVEFVNSMDVVEEAACADAVTVVSVVDVELLLFTTFRVLAVESGRIVVEVTDVDAQALV